MCLHGTAQSGQEQDMARSWARSGKRERPQLENTSSIWRGISPARSFALYRARGEGGLHPGPVRLAEAAEPDADPVRPCPRSLDAGADGARCDPEVEDLARACVGAATPKARAHAERLEDGDEPSRPPALADLAAAAARFDAALDPPWPRRRPVPVVPVAIASHSPSYS